MSKTYKKLSVIKKSANFVEAVNVVNVPLVPPKDDQILLKNIYAGVNATDINRTAARVNPDSKVPFDIGLESLGVVEAVGKNVTMFKVGQPAMFFSPHMGAYSEYVYARPEQLIPVPSLKPEFIALLVCGLTASIGLDQLGRIKKGDKVLITASAGGTGHIGVQWAKQKGCYVIGMTSSAEKAKLLTDLGCDRVINYKTENLDKVLTNEYPAGIDVIWETIGGQVFETLFKHLAAKGRLVIVGGISGYKTEGIPDVTIPNLPAILEKGNKSLSGFLLTHWSELFPQYLKQLTEDVVSGKFKVILDFGNTSAEGQFFGIDSVVRGVEHLHSGRNVGKVVIKLQN